MVDAQQQDGGPATEKQPSEEELRAAYEAELNRISSAEMILQTAVSLINIGGRRLGLAPAPAGAGSSAPERDLEQVRDAIDAVSALLPVLERRMPSELRPLRDAVAQLQMAYAREAQGTGSVGSTPPQPSPSEQTKPAETQPKQAETDQQPAPGPAQASGRLWVPGR